jgi:uncharacterized protein (TIGR02246 family)
MSSKKVPYIATLLAISVGIALSHYSASFVEARTTKGTSKVACPQAFDETSIRNQMASLAKALAEGDAKALATLWTEDGSYIDADGTVVRGRAALEQRFAGQFKDNGKHLYELTPEKVRILSNGVGQCEGTVLRKEGPSVHPETRYLMVFVKPAGSWLIASAVETPISSADLATHENLSDLSWLIGEWKAERNGASAKMKAEWSANKNFIRCTYEIKKPNQPAFVDFQVIGWDPIEDQIVSWLFDSSGGTGHGYWEKNGSKWIVESVGVEHDGSTTSAINIIEPTEPNSFLWQSLNRSIDGIALGDTLPLKVERIFQ